MKREMTPWLLLFLGASSMAQDSKEATLAVRSGNNLFSSRLYDAIRKDTGGNLVVSPLSVSTAVAMLQAGARGGTAQAIRSSFHFPANNQLYLGYQSLLQQLQSDGNITLDMVNRIYPAEGFDLNLQFSRNLRNYFGAEPHQLNYGQNTEAAGQINYFVNKSTHGKIPELIAATELNERTRLVLINAIYFKGNWEHPFPKKDTTKMEFYTSETASVEVDMMRLESKMYYGEIPELNATAVSLSYEGDRWRMIVLLPNERTGLIGMEEKLKTVSLDKIVESMRYRKVQLYLPKFKVESTIDLEKPLTELGAGIIFNGAGADFSGISASPLPEKLFVSKALQKAFIEVNEEGSEAAAATIVGAVPFSRPLPPQPVPVVLVDHPFYSMIVHRDVSGQSAQTSPVFVQRIAQF